MEKLEGDLLLGLKFVKLEILSTSFIEFGRILGLRRLTCHCCCLVLGLAPIKKNFYFERPSVANMSPDEVEDFRLEEVTTNLFLYMYLCGYIPQK